ncbi:hypothetical protein OHB41_38430 [Streptomyces sp. NBC_01571]|uniref:hypothetical protein n=1 Tax=Streptomyces sp. NBC_01571 TaxID=2975883 RepID=UPI00224C876D|nr:hypothetical protein [Streptomyces sp. NBC_01571]MCX4578966.1 hypothetical protein [Streptomyces sp. NBC_01571]
MSRDHQQPPPAAPWAIRLTPDTTMALRFIAEPTERRRHRRALQPPHRPTESGPQETPAG